MMREFICRLTALVVLLSQYASPAPFPRSQERLGQPIVCRLSQHGLAMATPGCPKLNISPRLRGHGFQTMPAFGIRWSYERTWFIAEGLFVQGLMHTHLYPEGTEPEPGHHADYTVVPRLPTGTTSAPAGSVSLLAAHGSTCNSARVGSGKEACAWHTEFFRRCPSPSPPRTRQRNSRRHTIPAVGEEIRHKLLCGMTLSGQCRSASQTCLNTGIRGWCRGQVANSRWRNR